jgi:hypothetical protein
VDSDAWREMIKAVAAAGPTYMPVSRNALVTTELEKQVYGVNKQVKHLLTAAKEHGNRIKSDGWADANRTYDPYATACMRHTKMFLLSEIGFECNGFRTCSPLGNTMIGTVDWPVFYDATRTADTYIRNMSCLK